jgi:hypothetical protein
MTSSRFHARRALCLAGMALWVVGPATGARPLPVRNLVVEMRVVDDAATMERGVAGGATVSIGSRGRVDGSAAVVVQGRTQNQQQDLQQSVVVLNGARATLRLAQGQLVDDTEVAWTPWGPAAAVRSQWVELVNGMDVWPRWPGGNAPVTLDIAAQSTGRSTLNAGQLPPPQLTTLTTVQAPLGEWVEVARLQRRQATVSNGFGAATSSGQRSLQVRVSLP